MGSVTADLVLPPTPVRGQYSAGSCSAAAKGRYECPNAPDATYSAAEIPHLLGSRTTGSTSIILR